MRNSRSSSAAITLALSLVASFAASHAQASTQARDYSVFVATDITGSNAQIGGWVAAGGNISITNYSVAGSNPAGSGSYAAVAGGSFTANGGTVDGSALASSFSLTSFSFGNGGTQNTYGGGATSPVNISSEMSRLSTLSSELANNGSAYGTVGTYTMEYGQMWLVGSDTALNIFNISEADWNANTSGWHLATKSGSFSVFNVAGTSLSIPNVGSDNQTLNGQNVGFTPQSYDASKVLYNFYQATTVHLPGSVNATILAPGADITTGYGATHGQIFADAYDGNGTVTLTDFGSYANGTNLLDTQFSQAPVPEPASWAMMLAGFLATGGVLRRKRRAFSRSVA